MLVIALGRGRLPLALGNGSRRQYKFLQQNRVCPYCMSLVDRTGGTLPFDARPPSRVRALKSRHKRQLRVLRKSFFSKTRQSTVTFRCGGVEATSPLAEAEINDYTATFVGAAPYTSPDSMGWRHTAYTIISQFSSFKLSNKRTDRCGDEEGRTRFKRKIVGEERVGIRIQIGRAHV